MSKLSHEDKIKIYEEIKQGKSIINTSKKYNINRQSIYHIIKLIDKHGFDILRTTKNRKYSSFEKQRIINRVLINNESIRFVAIDEGLLSFGMLSDWISKYKESGYNIVERKRGRSTMPKLIKKKDNETLEEKVKRLEEENLYLKAEIEYSKKLRAVVQARKNQQQKKK